jgi:hypothetical protein
MKQKELYDARGKQSNIVRLAGFDTEAFVHMLFYRILVFYSIVYGLFMLYAIVIGVPVVLLRLFTAIEWILITPQAYETVKTFSLISSRGLAFGHLSEEYTYTMKKKYNKSGAILKPIPYAAMVLWVAGFVIMLMRLSL